MLSAFVALTSRAELPTYAAETLAHFEKAGVRLSKDKGGTVTKLFYGGKPALTTQELQLIGHLQSLEQIALNAPDVKDDEWGFLKKLPNLQALTIWHCKTISSLKPFSGLQISSLTVGGCMGLRNLNQESPEKNHDAVLTLTDLPNLTKLNLYHSPKTPNDAHLAHLAEQFPKLEDLKLDFQAPRGFETSITPDGLAKLQSLPLKVLSLENVQSLGPDHMVAIAGISSLEALLVDARRGPPDVTPLVASIKKQRPELDVQVANEGEKAPPKRSRS
tara:strand:- start:14019 stop:14843 length:825 start_codon:yes stop_codon:yes gene_type:complete